MINIYDLLSLIMVLKFILFICSSIILTTTNANAYIDPGSGSIILQAIIGVIAAGGLTIKIYWNKLKDLFRKKNKKKID